MGIGPASPTGERMLVVGVGSGTKRVIKMIHQTGSPHVDTLFVTTDEGDLKETRAKTKFLIGKRLCGGKGAMGLTELGERSAEDARRDLERYMKGYGLIVQIATLGKGTASGASSVIASIGEGLGAFVINLLVIPSAVVESLPRTIANHAKNRMTGRGFNVISIDQDRFQEIHGNVPFSRSLAALDALLSWIVTSLGKVVYGQGKKAVTISDLRTVFKEGNEGSIFIGGSSISDPSTAAEEFLACGLAKRDPRTGRGFMLNLVTPEGTDENSTKPFVEEVLQRMDAANKTFFIGNIEDPRRRDMIDLIGIITGMDDGTVKLSDLQSKGEKAPRKQVVCDTADRWQIPMIR